jgi:pyroglutamyl-peptidase
MAFTVLLTGFGAFPGAPFNPTGPLVRELARHRHGAFVGVRRLAHVFPTSYQAVDRELPELIAREAPDLVVMFGLAQRTRHLRIESCARNALSRVHRDVAGLMPSSSTIAPGAPATLALRAPLHLLLAAARTAGMPAALSRDAGRYLCNYLCWRASEHAARPDGPRLIAFVHVPSVVPTKSLHKRKGCGPFTLAHLVHAGEAIVLAALAAARSRR